MDLSVESRKYRLCQIDKTVKIFENVAFSGSHYFKSIYLLQARNISILDIVSTTYSFLPVFYHFVKHRPENKVLNLRLQNKINVLAYFTLNCCIQFHHISR